MALLAAAKFRPAPPTSDTQGDPSTRRQANKRRGENKTCVDHSQTDTHVSDSSTHAAGRACGPACRSRSRPTQPSSPPQSTPPEPGSPAESRVRGRPPPTASDWSAAQPIAGPAQGGWGVGRDA